MDNQEQLVIEEVSSQDDFLQGTPVPEDGERVAEEPDRKAQRESRIIEFPPDAIVGSVGEYARTMAQDNEVPEVFYFASGLTMVGAICGGRLNLNLPFVVEPRLYTVLLGESYRVKKSTALKHSLDFFSKLQVARQPSVTYGVASAEGLVRRLDESHNLVIAYDELRTLIDKCQIRGSSLLPMITSLFEATRWQNDTKREQDSASCEDAHLSLIGCCTSDTYAHMWTKEAIGIGLTNRLFVVTSDAKPRVAWPKNPDPKRLEEIRKRLQLQLAVLPHTFDITDEGRAGWGKWYNNVPPTEHARRLDTIGFRLMALIALTTDKREIDLETVEVVCRILDYELSVRALTDPIDADGKVAKLEENIRRQLAKRGDLTENRLRQYTHADRDGLWAFRSAISNLLSAGDIAFEKKTTTYRLIEKDVAS